MSPLADLEISNKPVRSVILGFYSLRFVLLLRVALQAASKFDVLAIVSGNETPQDYCTAVEAVESYRRSIRQISHGF